MTPHIKRNWKEKLLDEQFVETDGVKEEGT